MEKDLNPAEIFFLRKSGRPLLYPQERTAVIETQNSTELGKLTALSLLYWVSSHPDGVIALPTGKTPETFIRQLEFYGKNRYLPEVRKELQSFGIPGGDFPDTSRLKFVQLDEFYPIDRDFERGFTRYVEERYLNVLGIAADNALLMDFCFTDSSEEKIAERCLEYEKMISSWGGIGFFLGGIGPDGHIAFNMPGSPADSRTRLVTLNYPATAAAAIDLGGIERARNKKAVTIGLGTIALNKEACIIIMASGESKARAVAAAVEENNPDKNPANAFLGMKGFRLYVTGGAAGRLSFRKLADMRNKERLTPEETDEAIIDLALSLRKKIIDLTRNDFLFLPAAREVLKKNEKSLPLLLSETEGRLIAKIERGLETDKPGISFLHTAPHHDDIMLSYHPLMKKMLRSSKNRFVYFTSGFNSVTDDYVSRLLNPDIACREELVFAGDYQDLLRMYIEAAVARNEENREKLEKTIIFKKAADLFQLATYEDLREKIEYLRQNIPGECSKKCAIEDIRKLKGAIRESEAERMLFMAGADLSDIHHLRAKFYTGDCTSKPTATEGDVKPFLSLLQRSGADTVTLALDPEGTGPDTHYRVMQIVAEALKIYGKRIRVIGYRNVWHTFSPVEANLFYPVTGKEIEEMKFSFLNSFSTQKRASFPSPELDGPFSSLAEKIQREQFAALKILLGEDFFAFHKNPFIKGAAGFIFLKEMEPQELFAYTEELRL